MASSKDKAISLKNNYVAGLIEAGATAPMPSMPEQDMGDQAGILINLPSRTIIQKNDGNNRMVVADGSRQKVIRTEDARFPLEGRPYGAKTADIIQSNEMMNNLGHMLHSGQNSVDVTTYGRPINSGREADSQYQRAMYQTY